MEQICTLHTLNLFIVKSVNCLGKKYVHGWNMYFFGFNGIFRKSIGNIPQNSDFSITTNLVTLIELLLGLTDQFPERKRECCTFRPGNCYYLTLFDILFFNILSWVLLLNDWLERTSPQIIAKLDEHITFVSFSKVFLILLSWLFFYTAFFVIRAYYIFLKYNPTFHRSGHKVRFLQQWVNEAILYKQKGFNFFQKRKVVFT